MGTFEIVVIHGWSFGTLLVLALGFLAYRFLLRCGSNRKHCFANCFFWRDRDDQCLWYGSGHRAKYPCPDYQYNKLTDWARQALKERHERETNEK